jgi:hypothetical protein
LLVLLERMFLPWLCCLEFRDFLSLSNTLLIISSKSDLSLTYKTKKTEAITSAAWLSAQMQTLGFAPPPHNGFAISGYQNYWRIIHKAVSWSGILLFHMHGQRSKIDGVMILQPSSFFFKLPSAYENVYAPKNRIIIYDFIC